MTCNSETLSSETRETRNDNDDFDRHIARRLHSLPLVDTKLNQLGYSTDGVRSTVGTRHVIFYVWVFFVVRRVLCIISYKALSRHIWQIGLSGRKCMERYRPFDMGYFFWLKNGPFSQKARKHYLMRLKTKQFHRRFVCPVF